MIIHSIVSENDIFFTNGISQPVFKNVNGGFVEIDETDGIKQVKRLYSTDPKLYLEKRYSPYSII